MDLNTAHIFIHQGRCGREKHKEASILLYSNNRPPWWDSTSSRGEGWAAARNVPLPRVESDGPRVLHASGDQRGAHVSVELGHLDLVQIAVDPVEFPRDPVHGQALGGGQAVLHDHLDPRHPWNHNDNHITSMPAWRRRDGPPTVLKGKTIGRLMLYEED